MPCKVAKTFLTKHLWEDDKINRLWLYLEEFPPTVTNKNITVDSIVSFLTIRNNTWKACMGPQIKFPWPWPGPPSSQIIYLTSNQNLRINSEPSPLDSSLLNEGRPSKVIFLTLSYNARLLTGQGQVIFVRYSSPVFWISNPLLFPETIQLKKPLICKSTNLQTLSSHCWWLK